ncbi:hypothetical protein IH982_02285 [Patescibacteria group bacterium]|nr:hypothetical protein [Patescibacteria group bacterium]
MAVTFLQKKKIQRLLILALGVVVFITAVVIWWGFFVTAPFPTGDILLQPLRVEVDTSILSHPILQKLDEAEAKAQIPQDVGRDNPLLPPL